MRQNPTDDELRSYLLGKLPDPQAAELEELILKDDELFDLVEGLEAELLATAMRGELAPAERERVLRRLASSPEGRERSALARSLNTLADNELADKKAPFFVLLFRSLREAVSKPLFQQWAALAAAGLLVAVVGLVLFAQQRQEDNHPPTPIFPKTTTAQHQTEPSEPTPETTISQDQHASQAGKVPVEVRPEPVLLQLALMSSRGSEEGTQVKTEKRSLSSSSVLKIQLNIDEWVDRGVPGPFQAIVRNSEDNKTAWHKEGLTADNLGWTKAALVLDVPAEDLRTGRYEVTVTAGPEGPEGFQEFEIVRKDQ